MTIATALPWIGLAAAVLGWLAGRLLRARRAARRDRTLSLLRVSWGKRIDRRRDLDACRGFVGAVGTPESDQVDEHTWRDLDMDDVFAEVDRTLSSTGELVLYSWLRAPATDAHTLERRDRAIRVFQQDARSRDVVGLALARLGSTPHPAQVVSLLWEHEDLDVPYRTWLEVMTGVAVVSLVSPAFLGPGGWFVLAGTFAVNFLLHYRIRYRFGPEIDALRYLAAALGLAGELGREQVRGLEDHFARLADSHRATRRLARSIARVPGGGSFDLLYEYVNILFLLEARGLARALRDIGDPGVRMAFVALGELDALRAAASFRDGLPWHCAPSFTEGAAQLEVEDVFHPLLEKPVPNSVSLQARGTLITGTNMSGKSTFLRALGVNAILARTIHTCVARRYQASRLRVLSCMRAADDLRQGKSTYWAEAERLLAIIRSVDGTPPALCLIDELLAGTNSAERLAASVEILEFLSRQGALLVSTTHSLELTTQLEHALDCYHFLDFATAEGIRFDYTLRPGVSATRNALRLLGILGYPSEIVEGAMRRVSAPTRAT